LNVITLRLRRLLENEESAGDARAIHRSVREIAAVVARLQEFAAAPRPTRPQAVDVNETVRRALELVRARLGPSARVHVESRLAPDLPAARADPDGPPELLTAFCLGADDATPPEGAVAVETRATRDGGVAIRVVDRGPTLTDSQIDRLFDPLLAGEAERALNFSMGRQAVRRWGGEVQVMPAEGGGNLVEIRLR